MKVAVFVSAGLGDALLLVPMVKELKKGGAKVSGIFTSSFECEQLFYNTNLFDEIIVSSESIGSAIISSLKNFRKFDIAYLNFFAATKKNLLLAGNISKKIVTNNPQFSQFPSPVSDINLIEPLRDIHDATQNLRLLNPATNDSILSEEFFWVDFQKIKLNEDKFREFVFLKNKKYFAIQISSGNNIQQYKNWNTKHWIDFIKQASEKFSGHYFLLLGELREKEIADAILNQNIQRTFSVVGKTGISEAVEFIRRSELFIGLDGGLMHIAVASGKPTFTLWGASDFNLYGYEKINPSRHKIVYRDIPCRPCNSWIYPNTSRVKNPMKCPDYICMGHLAPDFVFNEFLKFYDVLK